MKGFKNVYIIFYFVLEGDVWNENIIDYFEIFLFF